MLKHISVSDLKPGMQVVDPGLDWISHPYLYMADVFIDSEESIRRIVDEGYQEVYIDPERSAGTKEEAPRKTEEDVSAATIAAILEPKVAFEEELEAAEKTHDIGVAYVRDFMRDMRAGKLDMEPAGEVVNDIMDSLDRNASALLSLSRLRRKDSYTYMHCVNVCVLTSLFARCQGKNAKEVYTAGMAGLFHDLGKSLISPNIVNAPRKLTNAEWAVMTQHPKLGYDQMCNIPGMLDDVLTGALQHHEKFNGAGYPLGIAGDAISEAGRMVGVADIFDALTSKRVYKEAMYPHKALGIMYNMREKEHRSEDLVHFIRMVGIYPVGSVVKMEDGSIGVVSVVNNSLPSKPVVIMVLDPQGKRIPGKKELDLTAPGSPVIATGLAEATSGVNPAEVLGITE